MKKKGDFVFQTGHVIEIVTKLFLVVQNATGKPPAVNINTQFDANFGTHSVTFQFKVIVLVSPPVTAHNGSKAHQTLEKGAAWDTHLLCLNLKTNEVFDLFNDPICHQSLFEP